jgi:glycerol transport system substrate-binding protein
MSRKETSSIITRRTMLKGATALAVTVAVGLRPWSAEAALDAAQTWVDNEFQPSTLTKDQQMEEMKFFVDAAKPYAGMDINVVSETIDTHVYETKTLAKAFREITGINLKHDIIQEGDVIEKLQTQMQSGKNVFDMYINDSDLIGTHFRYGFAIPLSDFMTGEGKDVTLPTLDVDDFIGKSFTTAPDGKLYQLPDQQFANLYWFRYDWFTDPQTKAEFKKVKGYDLGVQCWQLDHHAELAFRAGSA